MQASEPSSPDVVELFRELVITGQCYELSHPLANGMPVYRHHAPYTLTLHRRHGDPHPAPRAGDSSFANEMIVMPGHVSTHIDALGHFSRCGCVHGGTAAEEIETHQGLSSLDAAEIAPIWRRGIVLDVASARGVPALDPGEAIRGDELAAIARQQETPVCQGDVVMIRTGWARHWSDVDAFNGHGNGFPGPCSDGAQWLIEHGAAIVGSDTPAFEAIPSPADSVHAMLLVDRGIHIMENLDLEAVAARRVYRFLFVGLPLRLVGATGSPLRPIALA